MILFVVTRSPIKAIASVQRAGNGMWKTGVNDYNVLFVKKLSQNMTILFSFVILIRNLRNQQLEISVKFIVVKT